MMQNCGSGTCILVRVVEPTQVPEGECTQAPAVVHIPVQAAACTQVPVVERIPVPEEDFTPALVGAHILDQEEVCIRVPGVASIRVLVGDFILGQVAECTQVQIQSHIWPSILRGHFLLMNSDKWGCMRKRI